MKAPRKKHLIPDWMWDHITGGRPRKTWYERADPHDLRYVEHVLAWSRAVCGMEDKGTIGLARVRRKIILDRIAQYRHRPKQERRKAAA